MITVIMLRMYHYIFISVIKNECYGLSVRVDSVNCDVIQCNLFVIYPLSGAQSPAGGCRPSPQPQVAVRGAHRTPQNLADEIQPRSARQVAGWSPPSRAASSLSCLLTLVEFILVEHRRKGHQISDHPTGE